jgi:hypothetical protein
MARSRLTRLSALATLAGAAATAALGLNGCAASSSVSSVVDPVAQAAEASELAPGFKASIHEQITPPDSSEPITGSGSGIFDQQHRRGTMSISVNAEGHSTTVASQYAGTTLYMRTSHGSSITHDKPWIEFDLSRVSAALGVSYPALSSSEGSSPTQMLSYLRASGEVSRIGTETVRGTATTHYRATIDYDRYATSAPPSQRAAARSSAAAIERLTDSHDQVVDVWIDAHHRVRREQLTYQECLPGSSGATKVHVTFEYFDFAVQAIPRRPRRDEVADLTDYIEKQLKHVKLGCG